MTKRTGFSLAEVLITLAVIGVVAAMTIPTLIINYQERAWNTGANVFNRNLGESLRMMNVVNELRNLDDTEQFVSNLSKYMKITTTCANNNLTNCFEKQVVWGDETIDINDITSAKNLGKDNWGTNVMGLQFSNGTSALVAYNPDCDGNVTHSTTENNVSLNTECVAVVFDTSGNQSPNYFGKDLRSVNVSSMGKSPEITWDYIVATCNPTVASGGYIYDTCIESLLYSVETEEQCNKIDTDAPLLCTSSNCASSAGSIRWKTGQNPNGCGRGPFEK